MVKKIKKWWDNQVARTIIAGVAVAVILAVVRWISSEGAAGQQKLDHGEEAYQKCRAFKSEIDSVKAIQSALVTDVKLIKNDVNNINSGITDIKGSLENIRIILMSKSK